MDQLVEITERQIGEWDKYKRVNFFNQLSGVRTPFLIGTRSNDDIDNLAIFNSVVHIGANPPLLGFIMRPTTVERHTYSNIKSTKVLSMNLIHDGILEKAHQTSAKYPIEESEFEAVGLSVLRGLKSVPYVEESNVSLHLEFVEEHKIKNGTILLVCEIKKVLINAKYWSDQEDLDFSKMNVVGVSGLYNYYTLESLKRLEHV